MIILHKILHEGRVTLDSIPGAFSAEKNDTIYPTRSQNLISRLVEEPEMLGYLKIEAKRHGEFKERTTIDHH